MLTDFRKAPTVIQDLFIDGVKVERATEYKYIDLGTVLDNKLNFNKNTDSIHKGCQPIILRLQKQPVVYTVCLLTKAACG